MRHITFDELVAMHVHLMRDLMQEEYYGILNADLLHSALARPRQVSHYEKASSVRQAAFLFQGLLMNHGFVQGNKRTAYATLEWFFRINNIGRINATAAEKIKLCVSSENEKWSVEKIEKWLKKHLTGVKTKKT